MKKIMHCSSFLWQNYQKESPVGSFMKMVFPPPFPEDVCGYGIPLLASLERSCSCDCCYFFCGKLIIGLHWIFRALLAKPPTVSQRVKTGETSNFLCPLCDLTMAPGLLFSAASRVQDPFHFLLIFASYICQTFLQIIFKVICPDF